MKQVYQSRKRKQQKTHNVDIPRLASNFVLSNISPPLMPAMATVPFPATETANIKRQCPRITEYIQNRQSRLKSYFRRRHVPFKRTFDMDLQCGTCSLLVQISDDIEECLYFGDERLVERFLDHVQGLRLCCSCHNRCCVQSTDCTNAE